MATIADLSGEEREERAAELKRKMQEAAQRTKAALNDQPASSASITPTPVAEVVEEDTPEVTAVEEQPAAAAVAEAPVAQNGNSAARPAVGPNARVLAARPKPAPIVEEKTVDPAAATMNRREFLMYTWGAALGLLTLESGVASYFFLYPRFRAGEFGGLFYKALSDFGDPTTAPNGEATGKFWMITTESGEPKAIYMVCTHLGCLYKWVGANNRFECPCHGSKFSHDGFYIEGPAPRSLDSFEVAEENGQIAVNTGAKITGSPSTESPARSAPV
jgi:cytochrome b6-f complex iron-sulfur subunit